MNRDAVVPQGWCAPNQLLFNEPTNSDPAAGYKISVEDAVEVSRAIRQECPHTYIVAVNFMQTDEGIEWAQDYIALGGEYDMLGYHIYCVDAQACIDYIERIRRDFEEPLCLTEYGTVTEDVPNFKKLVDYVTKNLACSAVFTSYWEAQPVFNMQYADGSLTPKGLIFARRGED
jgi:hypothetical protein